MVRAVRRILSALVLILVGATGAIASTPRVLVLDIHGAIGPATAMDVERAVERAEASGDELLVLRMDTPGGLDLAMRRIVRAILDAHVPVAGYVAPRGARAASAGTYILYAAHIAAMAPATNLGAATPVPMGGPAPADERHGAGKKPASPMGHKLVNDAAAYLRGLAELRGRNAEWAERAVREAASLPASAALREHVVDLIADDLPGLLQAIDGRSVQLADGQTHVLHTRNARIEHLERDWRSKILGLITNPNIAYILLLLGLYGLFFELANPGFLLPGVIGGICLLLALYAMQLLPIDFAGLALMLLGIGFMVAEAFVPSFGILGIGGAVAFVIGSLMLIDTQAPGFAISLQLVFAVALATAAFFVLVVGMALKARLRPVVSGSAAWIGQCATAVEDFADGRGRVRFMGELWNAHAHRPVRRGERVRIAGRNGLTLEVEPVEPHQSSSATSTKEVCQ